MKHTILIREVFQSKELPCDLQGYILFEFLVPFSIAQRELHEIEPFYEKRGNIGRHTLFNGEVTLDRSVYDYVNVVRVLLSDRLILDRRINDGRHEKYETVLGMLIETITGPIDTSLVQKGLEWDLFDTFLHIITTSGYNIVPGLSSYMERLVVRLKTDASYKKDISREIRGYDRSILVVALICLCENAVIYFLSGMEIRIDRYVCHFDSVLGDERLADIRKLYEKYKTEIDKHFIIVFPQ